MLTYLDKFAARLRAQGVGNALETSVRFFLLKMWDRRRSMVIKQYEGVQQPIVVQVDGFPLIMHPSMKGLSELLLSYGVHEPVSSEYYLRSLVPGDVIIDIGANIGYYALRAYAATNRMGRLICFEPVENNFSILQQNTEKYDSITVYSQAISDTVGRIRFFQSEIPNWGSLIQHDGMMYGASYEVDTVTLDAFLEQNPDIIPTVIRMDIEGGEIAAMNGAWKTIEQYHPKLFVELHPFVVGMPGIRKILVRLLDIGYLDAVYVDRVWDEPWIPAIIRNRKTKAMGLDDVIQMLDDGKCSHNFSLIIRSPST